MDNEELIRDQMEQTRTSLTEKVQALEDQVQAAAQNVTDTVANVTETVASVKDAVEQTVGTVKEGVQETMSTVSDSVQEGIETVKSLLDLNEHVNQHPFAMLAGSMAVGFCLGRYLRGPTGSAPPRPPELTPSIGVPQVVQRRHGNGKHHDNPEKPGPGFLAEFEPEIKQLKGLALGALMGVVRELVANSVPSPINESVTDVIDSVTKKIGGTPVHLKPEMPKRSESRFATNRL